MVLRFRDVTHARSTERAQRDLSLTHREEENQAVQVSSEHCLLSDLSAPPNKTWRMSLVNDACPLSSCNVLVSRANFKVQGLQIEVRDRRANLSAADPSPGVSRLNVNFGGSRANRHLDKQTEVGLIVAGFFFTKITHTKQPGGSGVDFMFSR